MSSSASQRSNWLISMWWPTALVTFGCFRMRSISAACCAKVLPLPFLSISAKRITASVWSNDGTNRSFMPNAKVMKSARSLAPAIAA